MSDFEKNFKRTQRFIMGFIVFAFFVIVCYWIFMGVAIYKASNTIEKDGLQGVIHNVWCGKRSDCTAPGEQQSQGQTR